jgi:hypothetical protein
VVQLAVVSLIDDSPASEDGVVVVGRYSVDQQDSVLELRNVAKKVAEVKASPSTKPSAQVILMFDPLVSCRRQSAR